MEIYTNREVYSEVKGERKAQRQAKKSAQRERGGKIKKAVNSNLGKALIGGLSDFGKQFSQNSNVEFQPQGNFNNDTNTLNTNLPPVEPVREPMSTTTKVIIGLGVATAIGLGVYFGFFHKGKGKGKATSTKKK